MGVYLLLNAHRALIFVVAAVLVGYLQATNAKSLTTPQVVMAIATLLIQKMIAQMVPAGIAPVTPITPNTNNATSSPEAVATLAPTMHTATAVSPARMGRVMELLV